MNAVQKVKHMVLIRGAAIYKIDLPEINSSNIDEIYDKFCIEEEDAIQDGKQEVRECVHETDITPKIYARNYEVYIGAAEYIDGTFVAWPVLYGGGKHSEPGYAYDWVNAAFDVDYTTQTVVKYIFTERENVSQEN